MCARQGLEETRIIFETVETREILMNWEHVGDERKVLGLGKEGSTLGWRLKFQSERDD